jgi:hypothetical protein
MGLDVGRTVEVPALTAPSAPPLLELVSMGIVIFGFGFGLVWFGCGVYVLLL